MVKIGRYLLAMAMILGASGSAAANGFDVWVRPGVLTGDTTYTIGGAFSDNRGNSGRYWMPISELKWPLDVVMVALGGRAAIGRFSLSGEVAKNATSAAGHMEDSDWGVYYDMFGRDPYFSPTSKDVFSTSDTDLDALMLDVRGRYAFWQGERFATAAGIGVRYQKFSIVASNVIQYSPTFYTYHLDDVFPSDPFGAMVSGPGIDYEVTYTIPYVELSGFYRFGSLLRLEGSCGYSPLAQAKDTDDHLLRDKRMEGSGNGSAWLLELKLRLQATAHWFAAVGISGLFVDTSGTQEQHYYGGEFTGYAASLDETITSSQVNGSLEVGYSY